MEAERVERLVGEAKRHFANLGISNISLRHDDGNVSLTYEELFDCARKLLSETGRLAIIIPTVQYEKISALAKANNLFLIRQTNVRPTPNSAIKRYLLEFSPTEIPLQETDLTIELSRHNYTEEYKALTKDFYL